MGLSGGLDGALFGHVTRFPAVIAVDFASFAALDGYVSDLATPERSRTHTDQARSRLTHTLPTTVMAHL